MDVQKKLDEIVAAIEGARSMPMSASCVVNRAELLSRLEEVRSALPDSLSQAEALLGGREQMVEDARLEANRIIESAHAERGSLISDTQVARQSQGEAERIVAEARREAEEIRAEADDYVDSKLANFEVVLTKTIGSVDRGREKLLGQGPGLDEQGYEDADAPERSADPETLRRRADDYVATKLGAFEAVLSKTLEAVGRGRLKLTGHSVEDELGAHMAAQDAADAAAGHQTDAEFMAGLAAPVPEQAQQTDYTYDATPVPAPDYGYQQQEYVQQAAYSDPYAAQQQGYPEQAGYGYQPDYGQQQQAYADPQAQFPQEQQPYAQQQHQQHQHQAAALDETSLFDTGMIDLNRLRELEQGR
ncbi:cell division initiation protein [Streptomyces sp. H10-C2]|uniref:cell division initiation protein n=1 Tax=unclassified Streptomyces TaxID=2593676 RepID=UPI0024BB3DF2|nr:MULTISPECIES: cell division initiation protein [unclassified Streptomyces]MDJ0341697.1 cell division initiation protein [Streptomyces sp. PH10-H1]MDJ0368995.1 cell division initiation protein [Streptomyces sp. H10-C2]